MESLSLLTKIKKIATRKNVDKEIFYVDMHELFPHHKMVRSMKRILRLSMKKMCGNTSQKINAKLNEIKGYLAKSPDRKIYLTSEFSCQLFFDILELMIYKNQKETFFAGKSIDLSEVTNLKEQISLLDLDWSTLMKKNNCHIGVINIEKYPIINLDDQKNLIESCDILAKLSFNLAGGCPFATMYYACKFMEFNWPLFKRDLSLSRTEMSYMDSFLHYFVSFLMKLLFKKFEDNDDDDDSMKEGNDEKENGGIPPVNISNILSKILSTCEIIHSYSEFFKHAWETKKIPFFEKYKMNGPRTISVVKEFSFDEDEENSIFSNLPPSYNDAVFC